jgi:hypothetical protein
MSTRRQRETEHNVATYMSSRRLWMAHCGTASVPYAHRYSLPWNVGHISYGQTPTNLAVHWNAGQHLAADEGSTKY